MLPITLRSGSGGKGSPLTINEVDTNFSNLYAEVGLRLYKTDYTAADVLAKLKTVHGTGSGLDADLLDGKNTASTNTANTIVTRDSSGNFDANVITANSFSGPLAVSHLTGTLPISQGGTGATSQSQALTNLLPTGTTSGYVLKTSGPGSFYWGAETGSTVQAGTTLSTTRVEYTATAGQTLFTNTGTYTIGTGQLRVYINGVRQFPAAYTETSTTSFTLSAGVPAGTLVMAEIDKSYQYDFQASVISFSPTGNVTATNVQNAIAELETDYTTALALKANLASPALTGTPTTNGFEIGYKIMPQVAKATSYTLELTDSSKHIYYTGAANVITIPLNSSVAFPIGTVISIVNNGSGALTISSSGIVYLAGTSLTGSRIISTKGIASLMKVDTDTWFISGVGIS